MFAFDSHDMPEISFSYINGDSAEKAFSNFRVFVKGTSITFYTINPVELKRQFDASFKVWRKEEMKGADYKRRKKWMIEG